MTDRRPERAAYTGARGSEPPVPKDPPDQQIQEGEDPLDVPVPPRVQRQVDDSGGTSRELPDLDQSGAGEAGREPHDGEPETPEPEEPSG